MISLKVIKWVLCPLSGRGFWDCAAKVPFQGACPFVNIWRHWLFIHMHSLILSNDWVCLHTVLVFPIEEERIVKM